jgi:branched-chain amino acid transport system substrate-binding protein
MAAFALALGASTASFAQDIKIPNIIELSGGGAVTGNMWKNGQSKR